MMCNGIQTTIHNINFGLCLTELTHTLTAVGGLVAMRACFGNFYHNFIIEIQSNTDKRMAWLCVDMCIHMGMLESHKACKLVVSLYQGKQKLFHVNIHKLKLNILSWEIAIWKKHTFPNANRFPRHWLRCICTAKIIAQFSRIWTTIWCWTSCICTAQNARLRLASIWIQIGLTIFETWIIYWWCGDWWCSTTNVTFADEVKSAKRIHWTAAECPGTAWS